MINEAINHLAALQQYRNERLRCKNYTYGDQWKDMVTADDGRRITEEQYIREQGSAPLKNNLIRRIVRNVVGVFRNNYPLPAFKDLLAAGGSNLPEDCDTKRLEGLYAQTVRDNSLNEIYSRVLEEYLIGGMAIIRKRLCMRPKPAVLTNMVRPDSFFFNSDATDPRGWDIHTIGEIHSVTASELKTHFPKEYKTVYKHGENDSSAAVKIFEIWKKDGDSWLYHFINEQGDTLLEGESPYPSGSHPYLMKAYPFIDGEIHSFVADCIDQQRYINRLITLNDWVIRASAKGVLLFPESAIPDDLELDDIADQWSRYNGVIRYKAKTGIPTPQQVNTTTSNPGITELLAVQLKMMEDVSGINAALQGQLSSGSISGTLYEQQTRHALTGLADIIEGFRAFITESGRKDLELLNMIP